MHPFERAGLGRAPFHLVGHDRCVGPIRLDDGVTEIGYPGQPMGTCDFCGQGIANRMLIASSDGQRFVVGIDCVLRLGRDDNRLATDAERVRSQLRREQRAAAAQPHHSDHDAARFRLGRLLTPNCRCRQVQGGCRDSSGGSLLKEGASIGEVELA